jgi:hypothetical protein
MKALFVFLVLFASVFAGPLDGVCEHGAGESCMNSPDCSFCDISLRVNVTYLGTGLIVSATVDSNEPNEIPLILSIRDGEESQSKQFDLPAGGREVVVTKLERKPDNTTLIVEVRDRDIGSTWAFESISVEGMRTEGKNEILVPVLSVITFFSILFFGFKRLSQNRSPYLEPVPFIPMEQYAPPPKEEIIVVSKKKKYYYKKNP